MFKNTTVYQMAFNAHWGFQMFFKNLHFPEIYLERTHITASIQLFSGQYQRFATANSVRHNLGSFFFYLL